jgi:hypothetical protein
MFRHETARLSINLFFLGSSVKMIYYKTREWANKAESTDLGNKISKPEKYLKKVIGQQMCSNCGKQLPETGTEGERKR